MTICHRTPTPLDVVTAALAAGAGVPGRPLVAAITGQPCAGLRGGLRAGEAQAVLEALLSAGVLYYSGGRAVLCADPG